MENIELWIIGILFPATLISLIALKQSRHFSKYWKDLYFIQKDLNDKLKKASDGNQVDLKNGKLPIPRVSNSLLDLDGKTIPVTFHVSKFEPKIDIDLIND